MTMFRITKNINEKEKLGRFVVGGVLLAIGHGLEYPIVSVLAAVPLITGYFEWCPLKAVFFKK